MKWRFKLILLCFQGLFVLVIIQLFNWQIVKADYLSELGESQYGRKITLTPKRGEIKTSDNFSIAGNRLSYLVYANPKLVKNPDLTVSMLSPLLEVDPASISGLFDLDRFWVVLKKDITFEQKKKIEELKINGIGFEEHFSRYYPEASMAASLLGFVGKDDSGIDQGYVGLEGYYDKQLRGRVVKAVQIQDALDRPILTKIEQPFITNNGRSLKLHIDRVVQFLTDNELQKGIELYGAQSGLVIVMNPKTGAVIAMSSLPTFDPRKYWDSEPNLFINPIISSTYEPGSTFKPLIMASAIDAGLIHANTRCNICDRPVPIGGYEIKTWNNKYHPESTMTEVIRYSDNTGMVFVSQKLGLEKMIAYLKRFGIGDFTGIDLQGEVQSPIKSKESWYPIDVATSSFGQGISITPIQLISAFSAIANNGIRMEPHVVAQIETNSGEVIDIPPKELGKPISSKTSKIITEMMVNAVENGESKWVKPKGYRVAGKTGTAQIPIEGRYDLNKTIPSFIGFAPADDPKFLMLVVLNRPTSSIYGSETAAPIFFNIARKLLLYYGIDPE